MEEKSLALELVREQSKNQKALVIVVCFLIFGLVFSNMAWLYVWNQYETITVEAGEGSAIFQDGEGNEIKYGKDQSGTEEKGKTEQRKESSSKKVGD